jgi:hypothetical protein
MLFPDNCGFQFCSLFFLQFLYGYTLFKKKCQVFKEKHLPIKGNTYNKTKNKESCNESNAFVNFGIPNELNQRVFKKLQGKPSHVSVTIHFHPPKAYRYIKRKFYYCLPLGFLVFFSTSTCLPGFRKKAFQVLTLEVQAERNNGKEIICSLLSELAPPSTGRRQTGLATKSNTRSSIIGIIDGNGNSSHSRRRTTRSGEWRKRFAQTGNQSH